jgi:hypothetical protein
VEYLCTQSKPTADKIGHSYKEKKRSSLLQSKRDFSTVFLAGGDSAFFGSRRRLPTPFIFTVMIQSPVDTFKLVLGHFKDILDQ